MVAPLRGWRRRGAAVCSIVALLSCASASESIGYLRWRDWTPRAGAASSCQGADDREVPSPLWGCAGEAWEPAGPLSDKSFAGYAAGEAPIPDPPVRVDVKRDYGAQGDGATDDTAAFLAALRATNETGGVLFLPAGKYMLSAQLNLSSGHILRGAGRDATTLHFTRSLADIHGWGERHVPGKETSPWTWAGGMIMEQRWIKLYTDDQLGGLVNVTRPAKRGDTRLYVAPVRPELAGKAASQLFTPGEWVGLRLREDREARLASGMTHHRSAIGSHVGRLFGGQLMVTHMSRVLAVGPDWLELERPLHFDADLAVETHVARNVQFRVQGVGIEDLEVSFPHSRYLGHHEEPGWNAIELTSAINSWVRRVRVVNADSAVRLYAAIFSTIEDVQVTNTQSRAGGRWNGRDEVMQLTDKDGHMALALHWACFDNLVHNFSIDGRYHHELLVAGFSANNVFMNGRGHDLCLDHHGGAPHNNLWTNLELGTGESALRWSGDPEHFPFAGASNVFWHNQASSIPVPLDYVGRLAAMRVSAEVQRRAQMLPLLSRPASVQGFAQVVVDTPISAEVPVIQEAGDWLVDYRPLLRVFPANLFEAMRATRDARLKLAPAPRAGIEAKMAAAVLDMTAAIAANASRDAAEAASHPSAGAGQRGR